MTLMKRPLYLKRNADVQPKEEDEIAFIVGKNGMFRAQRDMHFRAVLPATQLPMLEEVATEVEWLLPPIPAELTHRIVTFFRQVHAAYRTEAVLHICYDATRKMFDLFCPEQEVMGGHAKYTDPRGDMLPPGTRCIGTVHSHGAGGAFHSGTDQHDEQWFNGIHATVGHCDQDAVEIVAALVVQGQRFSQPIDRIFAGAVPVVPVAFPVQRDIDAQCAFWHVTRKFPSVTCRQSLSGVTGALARGVIRKHWQYLGRYAPQADAAGAKAYRIALPQDGGAAWNPPSEWMTRVHPVQMVAIPQASGARVHGSSLPLSAEYELYEERLASWQSRHGDDPANAVPSRWTERLPDGAEWPLSGVTRSEIAPKIELTRRSARSTERRKGGGGVVRITRDANGRVRHRFEEDD
ncbi:hypothetical protein HY632_00365 [Candidatus Uhrbacteria bacterium]|nr:hypothetical protein [Candidatus Uhrbacteria bacterium]